MRQFHSLKVAEIQPDAEDAVRIAVEVPMNLRNEYAGSAGQHVVLRTQVNDPMQENGSVGVNSQELRRTYSLLNVPGEWPLRIAVRIHSSGRMSQHLARELRVGDAIDVLPPNGSFTPRSAGAVTGGVYISFAAGCGITPVLAVVRSLLQANSRNRVILFYGNTATSRTMCLEELLALKDRYLDRLSLHFVMSRELQEVDLYNGRVDSDKVHEWAQSMFEPKAITEYFVCGPGDMIEQVSSTLRALGVEAGRIHCEHFTLDTVEGTVEASANSVSTGPARRSAPKDEDGSKGVHTAGRADVAEVTILMDGRRRSFDIQMNSENILDAAMRAGVELPFSCRAGVCSTCRTKVVRGKVEMAENYALEDWEVEQGYILACQSTVKTPELELDYDEK